MTSTSRGRLALAAALSAVGLSLTGLASASATTTYPTVHVSIEMFAFTPSTVSSRMGTLVVWTNHDSVGHTTTSNQGFWNSGVLPTNASYSRRFNQAGSFPYHCAIHTEMQGRIRIPMRATPRTGGGTLVWALVAGTYDVQIERPGSTTWVFFRRSTTARGTTFLTSHLGRYHFRARTHHNATASGWSPAVSLVVG